MNLLIARRVFEVRVQFDWDRLLQSGAQVKSFALTELADLQRRLFHPWYHVKGRPAGWDWRGARPIGFTELLENPNLVTEHRRQSISRQADSLRVFRDYGAAPPVPACFSILTYKVGTDAELIVDGSHRLSAVAKLAETGWPFQILLVQITGPVLGEICPDLYHFGGGVPDHLLKDPEFAQV
jgi:hypothetical protein